MIKKEQDRSHNVLYDLAPDVTHYFHEYPIGLPKSALVIVGGKFTRI